MTSTAITGKTAHTAHAAHAAKVDTESHHHLPRAERRRLRTWEVEESARSVTFIMAADGWELALCSYSDPARVSRRHPVLLCHGLGSSRLAFDIDPTHSLARFLAGQGFDVYAIDLRGHGLSARPGRGRPHSRWGFAEYSELDLPAAMAAVLKASGAPELHFVGHSMGGLLLYAHAAIAENGPVRSGLTLGSSLDYQGCGSVFRFLAPLAPLSHIVPQVPIHWPALLSAHASRGGNRAFVDTMLVNPDNVELPVYCKMAATVMHPVGSRVLRDLALAINGRGMRDSRGRRYVDLLRQRGYSFPILAVAGAYDQQCSPEAARRFGTAFAAFGKAHGHRADYGHDDLIMGVHAGEEVWPTIDDWFGKHD